MKECKQCNVEMSLDLFYSHPLTKDGKMGRCKECIKKGRRSEEERSMARKWENSNRVRPDGYTTEACRKHRKENPKKYKARQLVSNHFRGGHCYQCSNCGDSDFIHMHHEDYDKPNEIIPLCALCHNGVHKGTIDVQENRFIIIPF